MLQPYSSTRQSTLFWVSLFTRIPLHRINSSELKFFNFTENSSKNLLIFRLILDQSNALINCLYLPLINIQLLLLYNSNCTFIACIVITSVLIALFCLIDKCRRLFLDIFIVTQATLLIYLSITFDDENYWLFTLAPLVALNFFTLPALAEHFYVPKHELFSVALVFQNIFLVNALF